MPEFYAKELPDMPLYLSNGRAFKFDLLETSDSWLIGELTAALRNGVGGVRTLTPDQYEEAKKNASSASSSSSPPSFPRQANTLSPLQFQAAAPRAGAVATKPPPDRVPPDPIAPVDPKIFVQLKPKVAKVGK